MIKRATELGNWGTENLSLGDVVVPKQLVLYCIALYKKYWKYYQILLVKPLSLNVFIRGSFLAAFTGLLGDIVVLFPFISLYSIKAGKQKVAAYNAEWQKNT